MTGRALTRQLRPKIEEMLLAGDDAPAIAEKLSVKASAVYGIKYQLKKAGKLN